MVMFSRKQANICVTVLFQSTPEIGVRFLGFFTFFIYENLTQEYNLLPDCAFGLFTYVCSKNCMSGFSASDFNLSKSGNILFRKMSSEKWLFRSASFSLVGKITRSAWTLVDDSCWATCKCNILCTTSRTEISLWKTPISNFW